MVFTTALSFLLVVTSLAVSFVSTGLVQVMNMEERGLISGGLNMNFGVGSGRRLQAHRPGPGVKAVIGSFPYTPIVTF